MSRNRNDSTLTTTPSAPSDSTRTTSTSAPSDSTATSSTTAPQNNNTSSNSTSSNSSTTTTGNTGSSTAASSGPSDARKKFNAAFAKARREGKMTFTFNGKKYGTRRGNESKDDHAEKMRKAAGLPSTEELDKSIKEGDAADRKSDAQAARRAGVAGQAADDKRRKEEAAKKAEAEKKTESKPAATTETKKPVNNTEPKGKRVPEAGGRPESDARAAQRARVNFALEQRDKKKADRKAKRSAVRAAKSEPRPGRARRQERRAVDKANRQNRRATIRDARRGGSTFQGGGGMKYGEKKKGESGLKMVKNKDGKSVPFYAADGKGKMDAGGKYKMAAGGKLMGDGGNKVPITNDRRAIKAGMKINYDDPFRYLSPSNRRDAERMQKEGTLRITGPAGGYLDDATFDQISRRDRRMKQDDYGKRSGRISGKSGAAGSPKAKAPVSLRLAPPVGMPDPPRQGGGDPDVIRDRQVTPRQNTVTIRGTQQDPSTRGNRVVVDRDTGRVISYDSGRN
jgi:hypothetical protein